MKMKILNGGLLGEEKLWARGGIDPGVDVLIPVPKACPSICESGAATVHSS